ncbi:SAM-dependent methyltransferase [Thauera sp. Sel9]|uniref:SAM-dependent methyltransferase n=1 Tax=Thauera sp. Sel9 TaxID=2974299 RepID=UPI0021E186A0|nr:class I SAM-dependent methyltransferase [Thauera sp. Sel9]MCV2219651.1 class I SAM-dependent methyltransferase [Thauera sp. Sel9]
MKVLRGFLIAAVASTVAFGGTAVRAESGTRPAAKAYAPKLGQAGKDVVWLPTSQALVNRMLDMAQLTPQDRLVDLGSGDGRMVITAAKRGATARGIEFNPDLVALARRQAEAEGVAARATFEQADIFQSDFSEATVVTLFLLPTLNVKLRPILLDMPPGTRIVANSFDMGDWLPDETDQVTEGCESYCYALKWTVPAKVAGTWEIGGRRLELTQNFQTFDGVLHDGTSARPLSNGRLAGAQVRFYIGNDLYIGEVDGDRMRGMVNGLRPWEATIRHRVQ